MGLLYSKTYIIETSTMKVDFECTLYLTFAQSKITSD
jgi:hypothetical protein